jgi:hypothetical protein
LIEILQETIADASAAARIDGDQQVPLVAGELRVKRAVNVQRQRAIDQSRNISSMGSPCDAIAST